MNWEALGELAQNDLFIVGFETYYIYFCLFIILMFVHESETFVPV